jgi:hypothetical protein
MLRRVLMAVAAVLTLCGPASAAKQYVDIACEGISSTGTGTPVNLNGVSPGGFQGLIASGVVSGNEVPYQITDGSASETGWATITDAATDTMTRTVVRSTNSNARISLTGTAVVCIGINADVLTGGSGFLLDADKLDGNDSTFFQAGPLSGDVVTSGAAATIQANSVALTTDTSGSYAAGDAEAGAALTGDSATAFFSTGAFEDARVDGSLEADEVNPTLGSQTQGNYLDNVTGTATTGVAVTHTPGEGSEPALAFDFSDKGADPALTADTCVFNGDATSNGEIVCEGDTADTIETRIIVTDPTASDKTFTIGNGTTYSLADADKGDITVGTSGTDFQIDTDAVGANEIVAGAVGTSEAAALDAGDITTGAFVDARVDGSLEADEVNPTLGTQTAGNYQVDTSGGTGIAVTHTPSEGSTATVALSYTDKGTDPALATDECYFSSDATTAGNIVCEGDTANTAESRMDFGDPSADRVFTLPNADSYPITDKDYGDITVSASGQTWAVDADSIALTTDTTGSYAAGDGEAGNALTGDSATAFFSAGTIEDARIDGSAEADEVLNSDKGDFTCATGSCTVDADAIALTTDTSGVYVAQVADGTGIDGSANAEGATYTPSLDLTEINSFTLGAGSATSITWDVATSDPVITGSTNTLTISSNTTAPIFVIDDQGAIRWTEEDANGSNYKGFAAPGTVTADTTCTFEDDASFIPDSCVGDGSDAGADGLGPDGDKGDVTVGGTGTTLTVDADSVALTTDTTGSYAAGDAEAGAALTGDSATAFFSAGAFEDARVDGSLEADEVNPTLGTQTQGNFVNAATGAATTGIAITHTPSEGSSVGVAFDYTDKGADPALSADTCVFNGDATANGEIVCEGDTADTIETRIVITDPTASDKTFTIGNGTTYSLADADKGDITVGTSGTDFQIDTDAVGANEIVAGAVGTSEAAALDAGDVTTGTFTDAQVAGSGEADELTLAGDVDGVANANDIDEANVETELEGVIDSADLQIGDEGTDPARTVDTCVFTTDTTTAGNIVCEGDTANTSESRMDFGDPTGDRVFTLPDANSYPITDKDYGDITVSASGQTWNLDGDSVGAAEIAIDSVALTTDTTGVYVAQVADGTGIDGTANAEGATYTPTLDMTEVNAFTLGGGSATGITFDVSAGDPVIASSANTLTFTGSGTSPVLVVDDQGAMRFTEEDGGGSNYKGFAAPAAVTADTTCVFEDDASFIPDSCVGDGTDAGGVDTLGPDGDKGDISVGGTGTTLQIDADAVTLTTDTNGNYVGSVADGTGIDGTAAAEGATYTPTLDLTEVTSATWGNSDFTSMTFSGAGAIDLTWNYATSSTAILSHADAGAVGPILRFHHDSATAADGDISADIEVYAGADDEEVARIALEVDDGATTTEDTRWKFYTDVAGTSAIHMTIGGGGTEVMFGANQTPITYSNAGGGTFVPDLQMQDSGDASFSQGQWSNSVGGPVQILSKSRSGTVGTMTVVTSGDHLGTILFQGADGVDMANGAMIRALSAGTPGSNDMPTDLCFGVSAEAGGGTAIGCNWSFVGANAASFTPASDGASDIGTASLGVRDIFITSDLELGGGTATTVTQGSSAGEATVEGKPIITATNTQVLTSGSGATYTPTSGTKFWKVTCVGGGGGGGGSDNGDTSANNAGGGGAGGGTSVAWMNATEMGANAVYTVGAGGTAGVNTGGTGGTGSSSTFNPAGTHATLTCDGGLGGPGTVTSADGWNPGGGPGTTPTGGDFNIAGGAGGYGVAATASGSAYGGTGGASSLGGGGLAPGSQSAGCTAGGDGAANTGGGGAGARCRDTLAGAAGGVGGTGVIIVEEFGS